MWHAKNTDTIEMSKILVLFLLVDVPLGSSGAEALSGLFLDALETALFKLGLALDIS